VTLKDKSCYISETGLGKAKVATNHQ